ncbi:MAG: hypothetical protein AABY00_00065, partial [Nanoarchaeota archaeon]
KPITSRSTLITNPPRNISMKGKYIMIPNNIPIRAGTVVMKIVIKRIFSALFVKIFIFLSGRDV